MPAVSLSARIDKFRRFSKQAVADALTASRKRLDVEQIALYQVHMPFDFSMGQPTVK